MWSGGLTAKQRCNIERIQKRAFRIIYPGQDYEHVLKVNKLATLEERRKDHCLKLISHMTREDHKLNHFLPPKRSEVTERNARANKNSFYNFFSRTNRFRNSPLLHAIDVFNIIMND